MLSLHLRNLGFRVFVVSGVWAFIWVHTLELRNLPLNHIEDPLII